MIEDFFFHWKSMFFEIFDDLEQKNNFAKKMFFVGQSSPPIHVLGSWRIGMSYFMCVMNNLRCIMNHFKCVMTYLKFVLNHFKCVMYFF